MKKLVNKDTITLHFTTEEVHALISLFQNNSIEEEGTGEQVMDRATFSRILLKEKKSGKGFGLVDGKRAEDSSSQGGLRRTVSRKEFIVDRLFDQCEFVEDQAEGCGVGDE